ncbi:MAG: transglutaminase domain-containing protein [Deltaproteobacteria bacterium]|nr:transglutaminase domain-containing protein [Deltaproteobacteria bacterium]
MRLQKNIPALACIILLTSCQGNSEQEGNGAAEGRNDLYELALEDRTAFASRVAAGASSDYERADAIVTWFAENFDWTYTDYERRTVEEILARKGGNCAELARVTTSMLEELGLHMREVREVNIHVESERRQRTAREKVAESGNRMSVFGKRHNDHVWMEIQDSATGEWFPADPSLGVVGERQWLASRLGFGERFSLDPSSEDMIVPFAIFAKDEAGSLTVIRTSHYVVEGFDGLYSGQLHALAAWPSWVRLVVELNDAALAAFLGEANLHESEAKIDELAAVYEQLRVQFAELEQGE